MKSRTKANCEWLVNHLKERGFWKEVPVREVVYEIDEHVGGDKRTKQKYLRKLVEYSLMKFKNASVMQFCGLPTPTLEDYQLTKFIQMTVSGDDEPP